MKLTPSSSFEPFLAELRGLERPFSKWKGLLFRASPLPYANALKLLNGLGSYRHGGRWSAAGTFPANNLSLSPETALKESGANFSYYNFVPSDVRPKVVVAIRARFSRVLDLVAPASIAKSDWLQLDRMLSEDWREANDHGSESTTQAFGRAAQLIGTEALLIPSARIKSAANLVYFPDSLLRSSKVEIMGEEELGRWLKKR